MCVKNAQSNLLSLGDLCATHDVYFFGENIESLLVGVGEVVSGLVSWRTKPEN